MAIIIHIKTFKNMANTITTAEATAAFELFLKFREALEKTELTFCAQFKHANNSVEVEFKICDTPFSATYKNDSDNFAYQLEDYCEKICAQIQNQWHADRAHQLQSEYWPSQITVEYDEGEYTYSDPFNEDEHGNLENDVTKLNMSKNEIEERFIELFGKFE